MYIMNMFALIDRAIFLRRKVLININIFMLLLYLTFLIQRFKMFKKRVKSKLKTTTRDALFK